jgi:hypothetical protein
MGYLVQPLRMLVQPESHSDIEYVHLETSPDCGLLGKNKDFHVVRSITAYRHIDKKLYTYLK